MISIKSETDIVAMREACRIAASALELAGKSIKPGVTTKYVDDIVNRYIVSMGAKPSFLGYGGFPATICISINSQVIHGIPSNDVIIRDGDLVSVDVGAYYKGFHGDNAATYIVGSVGAEGKKLVDSTKRSLYAGLSMIKPGARIGDISAAVQSTVEADGFSVVVDYVGHGVGRQLHEEPQVPNFGRAGRGPRLEAGMTLAVEPMVNAGTYKVVVLKDGWTTVTKDSKLSAHFEHTVLVTSDGCEILTVAK